MIYSTINDLIMLFNISLKVLHFDNIVSIIGRFYCKPEIPVNAHFVCKMEEGLNL